MRPVITTVTPDQVNQFYLFEASLRKNTPDAVLHVFTDTHLDTTATLHPPINTSIRQYMSTWYDEVVCIDVESIILNDISELLCIDLPDYGLARHLGDTLSPFVVVSKTHYVSDEQYGNLDSRWNQGEIPLSARSHMNCLEQRYDNTMCDILCYSPYEPTLVRRAYDRLGIMFPYEIMLDYIGLTSKLDKQFVDNISANATTYRHFIVYMVNMFNDKIAKRKNEVQTC